MSYISIFISRKLAKSKDEVGDKYNEVRDILSELIETRTTNQLIAEQSNMLFQQKADVQEAVEQLQIGLITGISGVFNTNFEPILSSISNSIAETNELLKASLVKLDLISGSSLDGIEKIMKEMAGSEIKRLGESIAKLGGVFDKFTNMQKDMELMAIGLRDTSQAIKDSMVTGGETISGNIEKINSIMDTSTEKVSNAWDNIFVRMQDMLAQLDGTHPFFESFQQIVTDLDNTTQSLEYTSTHLKEGINSLHDKQQDFLFSASNLLQQVERASASGSEQAEIIVGTVKIMKENWTAYNNLYQGLLSGLKDVLEEIQSGVGELQAEMQTQVADFYESIQKQANVLGKHLDEQTKIMTNTVNKILKDMDDTSAKIGTHFQDVVSDMGDVSQSFRDEMKKLKNNVEGDCS